MNNTIIGLGLAASLVAGSVGAKDIPSEGRLLMSNGLSSPGARDHVLNIISSELTNDLLGKNSGQAFELKGYDKMNCNIKTTPSLNSLSHQVRLRCTKVVGWHSEFFTKDLSLPNRWVNTIPTNINYTNIKVQYMPPAIQK